MTEIWTLAALWLGLALLATLLSIWLRIATALSEIVVGTIAQLVIGAIIGAAVLGTDQTWVKFLSGTGAILLTFLAGAELDPVVFRERWKEAGAIGVISFLVPFIGCAAAARYLLGWDPMASWLAGVAMSTTSVAVVYAVMLEFGFNATNYGKVVLAACFVTDLGTVLALGLIFAPFTIKTLIFVGACVAVLIFLPWITAQFFRLHGGRPSELETKYLLLLLFGLGGLAGWADSEAVLPAYLIGMILAGSVGKDHILIRRLRTLCFGFLTPFYFIRAGSFVSVTALFAAPTAFLLMLSVKLITKGKHVHDAVNVHRTNFRHYLFIVRALSQHHNSRPVFRIGSRRYRQRGRTHPNRQCVLPSTPSAARCGRRLREGERASAPFHS